MNKFDMHTHHYRCGHAKGTMEDYIKAALDSGLQVIGISDHSPYFAEKTDHPYPHITMAASEFEEYIKEIEALKQKYKGRIDVLAGVESDYFPKAASTYKHEFAKYELDYLIGSVHFVEDQNIFNKDRWVGMTDEEMLRVKNEYYHLIQQSARSGMFDILGHIDALKGYFPYISELYTSEVEQTLKVIGETETAIEVNTSGKMKYCGGWYPSAGILEMACHYDVPVTFGSDSHVPERVGDEWEEVRQVLKETGFKEWRYYKNRKPVIQAL